MGVGAWPFSFHHNNRIGGMLIPFSICVYSPKPTPRESLFCLAENSFILEQSPKYDKYVDVYILCVMTDTCSLLTSILLSYRKSHAYMSK